MRPPDPIKILNLILLLTVGHLTEACPASAREVRDATQTTVTLKPVPRRVVTLAPSLAETVSEILGDALDRIVGVSEYTDYPAILKKRESIGPFFKVNLEKIMALKPDLVLATTDGNSKEQIGHLRELGMPVIVVSTASFKEIEESIRLVGQALGSPERGEQVASQLHRGVEHIRERAKTHPKRRVLLQLGDEPIVVAGKNTFLNEAVQAVGATNLYGDVNSSYPRPSLEDIVMRNAEVIVIFAMGADQKPYYSMASHWLQFPTILAVKERHVHIVQGDTILRPSLRLLEGLSLLEGSIYGKK